MARNHLKIQEPQSDPDHSAACILKRYLKSESVVLDGTSRLKVDTLPKIDKENRLFFLSDFWLENSCTECRKVCIYLLGKDD